LDFGVVFLEKDAKTMSIAGFRVIMTARNTFANNKSSDKPNNGPEFDFDPQLVTIRPDRAAAKVAVSNHVVSKWLVSCQKLSIAFTALSFIGVSAVYGWNVHVQKKFDQQYRKLETLKQSERQLIVANESLAHDLITNLDRLPVKLVQEKPQQSIFITSTTVIPVQVVNKNPPKLFDPLGY
jgi:hypothetical protein